MTKPECSFEIPFLQYAMTKERWKQDPEEKPVWEDELKKNGGAGRDRTDSASKESVTYTFYDVQDVHEVQVGSTN